MLPTATVGRVASLWNGAVSWLGGGRCALPARRPAALPAVTRDSSASPDRRWPRRRLLREHAQDRRVERGRDVRTDLGRARRLRGHVLEQDVHRALTVERHLTGEHLEDERTERVDVRPTLDVHAATLLGRHVIGRAHRRAGLRLVLGAAAGREELHEPEVEQLGLHASILVEHEIDVLGLQIAMEDVLPVCCIERARDAAQDRERLRERQPLLRREVLVERRAVEQLHHVVLATVRQLSEREDVDDVAMADLIDRPRLGDEARDHLRVRRELTIQDLDGGMLADDGDGRRCTRRRTRPPPACLRCGTRRRDRPW